MIYMDKNRDIVKHWKDGKIEIIGHVELGK